MNKSNFIEYLSEKNNLSKREVAKSVDLVFGTIADLVAAGESVQISGFGEFGIKDRAARRSVNLLEAKEGKKNLSMIDVPAAKKVYFKVGSSLRRKVETEYSKKSK